MQKTYSNPEGLSSPVARYSHVVRVKMGEGALLYIGGQLLFDAQGRLVGAGDMARQAEQVFENLKTALEASGASMSDVVKTTTYLTDISQIATVNQVRARYFSEASAPTSTTMQVVALARPEWLLELEAVAAI